MAVSCGLMLNSKKNRGSALQYQRVMGVKMNENVLTVFLVDDDPDVRSSLSRALGKRDFVVETFASAAAFLAIYDGTRPGCLLLDYGMSEMNGLELQDHLNDAGHDIPIIFITGHGGIAESVRAMKSGAVDFLEKPFRQQTLVNCINEAFAKAVENDALKAKTKVHRENFARLTVREQEITQLMVSNSSSISSKEIGRQLDISPRTVDHHRARILEKMATKSVAELVDICLRTKLFEDAV
jgi:FixJ family two-component response regulator